jgi:hypothetical protein
MKLNERPENAVSCGCTTHVPLNGVSANDNAGKHKISTADSFNTTTYLVETSRKHHFVKLQQVSRRARRRDATQP